ncbi:MAG: response regulator [Deltaproteobacteria bacterium]|nr:response regulator [Deltaproteobacteria bacterium]
MIKNVLIIDDSPIARKILRSCMPQDRDFDFFEAGDGLSGLRQFEACTPDITFIDLTMPVMNGIEALKQMKKVNPNAVIIVASADIQPKTIEMVMSLGAFSMLRKPLSKEAVRNIIAKVETTK